MIMWLFYSFYEAIFYFIIQWYQSILTDQPTIEAMAVV